MLTGMQAVQKAIDEAKSQGNFSGGDLSYFTWKDKEVKILRFLTDDVITANFHEFIMTNDGKTKSFLIDPAKGDFVAKYASPTPGLGWKQDFKTKQPTALKPRELTVGLAVLRDKTPRDGGGFDIVDVLDDIEFKGATYRTRTFGLVTQSHTNFWKSLIGYFNLYGTICDRDYQIQRDGGGTDTSYTIIPLDKIDELADPQVIQEFYGYGRSWKDDDPDRFLFCPKTLPEWADYYSGEERAKHWLLPKDGSTPAAAPVAANDGFVKGSADEAQTVVPSANTDFSSLRDKLLAHKS